MDRFAYKLKGTSFDCIGTFRGCNRFLPPPPSPCPRLRLARVLALPFRPAKSPRFRGLLRRAESDESHRR